MVEYKYVRQKYESYKRKNLKFLIATLQKVETGEIYLNNMFHLTQYISNSIISTCNLQKVINESFYILYFILRL